MNFQGCFGTIDQTEILWQCSSATCYLILFSENLQRWSTNSWSHWSFWHCSRVINFLPCFTLIDNLHFEGSLSCLENFYDFLGFFAIVKVSRHTWYMDKRASWSLETHRRCCSCQRWSFLLSNLACGEGFKSRFVFDWDHLYIFSSIIACWQLNFCNGWRELNVL